MIGVGPEQPPRVGRRHVVPADMHAVAADGERHVDPVVDERAARRRAPPCMARARSTITRVSEQLVAQLHQRDAARGQHPAEIGQVVPAGHLGIDDGVAAQIDAHQLTLALASAWRGRARRPHREFPRRSCRGPRARAAATSPATPITSSAAAVAFHASGSTASAAPTSAEADAAHRGDARHQRIAVGDGGEPRAVAHEIVLAGEADHRPPRLGEPAPALRRRSCRPTARRTRRR